MRASLIASGSPRCVIGGFALLSVLCAPTTHLHAQSLGAAPTVDARPALLPRAREVELALSAGPAHVAAGAAVYVLRRGGYVRVREGTNGYACLVERDHPASLAPVCYDAEAVSTILPGVLRVAELREGGRTYGAAMWVVDSLYDAGALTPPRRPALSYMLSRQQVLYSDGDAPGSRSVGTWHPHLMLFYPGQTNAAIGHVPGSDGPFVVNEGRPTSHLVIAVRDWSDARPPEAP